MDMKIANAALAYAQALGRSLDSGGAAEGGGAKSTGMSFADMVAQAAGQSVGASASAEKLTMQSVEKKSELTDVAAAVTNAEVTLDTVMAVRDKVIAAYQDIIKMPI
jgi:flagellar hook-basal body complex protein FliE